MELTYCGSECFLPLETLYLQAYRRRSASRRTVAILLQLQNRIQWALNSAVECHPHTVEVVGSNPTAPTILVFLPFRRSRRTAFYKRARAFDFNNLEKNLGLLGSANDVRLFI